MIKEIAQRYIDHGWNVLPVKSKSKEPLIKWTDLQTRRVTSLDLNDFFKDETVNLGIITGSISKLVVVDADGQEGLDSLRTLSLSSPVTVLTGKGRHLYFSHTGAVINNSVRKIAPGIDIRGEGGYVLASPSIHPETGNKYRWLTDFRLPLPVFPTRLLDVGRDDKSASSTNSQGWLGEAFSNMQHGNMDETFTRVCGKLRYSGFSESDAFTILVPWIEKAEVIWPPANKDFLHKKIAHIWRSYEAKATVVVENEEAESVEDFLKVEEAPKWIVPGILSQQSISFCVGLPESAKTWLLMDLAIEASRGGDWLGLFPVSRTKTLFIDQERPRPETKRRLNSLLSAKNLRRADMGNLFIKSGSSIKIDLENSFIAFTRLMEKIRPGLVIIDSFATFHQKEENSRTDIQSVMERIKKLREQFECTFLFIHHANKFMFQTASEGKEPTIGEMAGSIALPAAAETVITVIKAKGGGSTVYHTKSTQALKTNPFGILVEDVLNGIQVRGVK